MHWTVAAPFVESAEPNQWLVPFVTGDGHRFTFVPAPRLENWHERSAPALGVGGWLRTWSHGRKAWLQSEGGIITVFPQLAVVLGVQQRIGLRRKPVVAWCFNMGAIYGGLKGKAARAALARVDRFVVHSRAEVAQYAKWLELPIERFSFVHLQLGAIAISETEENQKPFVLAMGSARRDYATFFAAMEELGFPTVVVAAPHALAGLAIPKNVEVRHSLPRHDCRLLAQRARVNVVPVLNEQTASGQVALLETMMVGRAVVATRCIGTEDYVEDGLTGVLVEPRSVEGMRKAILRLWEDESFRGRLGLGARLFVAEHCSDEAGGRALRRVLDEVEAAGAAPTR